MINVMVHKLDLNNGNIQTDKFPNSGFSKILLLEEEEFFSKNIIIKIGIFLGILILKSPPHTHTRYRKQRDEKLHSRIQGKLSNAKNSGCEECKQN